MPVLGTDPADATCDGSEKLTTDSFLTLTAQKIADRAGGPGLAVEFTADANLTLTDAQATAGALVFTDSPVTLTAGRDVVFPAHFPPKLVRNSTAQTLTLKKSGQAGVTLLAGADANIASGATDVLKRAAGDRAPAIQTVTSAATVTPTFADDLVRITEQAAALTLANPTGTAIPGLGMVIRIKDNGTARAITYGTQYRAIGITLPTTTVATKTTYLALIWNDTDSTFDVVATGTQA